MGFQLLPKRFTVFEAIKCLFLFVLIMLGVLLCIEKLFIDSWQRRDVFPYLQYYAQYSAAENVLHSFSKEPPQAFLDIYHEYGASKVGVEKITAFHNGILEAGYDGFGDDQTLFGQGEYFATAEEFLVTRSGDCDEHATVRYHVLSSVGYKASILIGYVLSARSGHAVVSVQIDGEDYILDINYPGEAVPMDEWVQKEGFIPSYTLDKNGLHIYHGNLYSV